MPVKKKSASRPAPARGGNKKGRTISVDMEGVESGGGGYRYEPGDYAVKVKEVELRTGKDSGADYINWELEITTEGEFAGKSLFHTTSLKPEALWNLRRTLEAAGMEIPDSVVDINLDDLEDLEFGVHIEDDAPYEGKIKSKVTDVFSLDSIGATGGGEEAPAEESEELTAADVLKADLGTLKQLNTDYELKIKPGDMKDIKKFREAVVEGLGLEAGEEEAPAEEETVELSREDVLAMDSKQLDGLVKDFELDIKPLVKKVIKKYREAVANALGLEE